MVRKCKIRSIFDYMFPCRDIHDRRENFKKVSASDERRSNNKLSRSELERALNKQFNSLATTISHAKDVMNDK